MDAFFTVLAYIAIIVIGQLFRLLEIFPRDSIRPMSMLVLYVTLPCSIVTFLYGVPLSAELIAPFLTAFCANWILIGSAAFLTRHSNDKAHDVPFAMLNLSGYNVGTFAMPYTAGIVSPIGFLSICLFDAGNSLMCTGGTYAFACRDGKRSFCAQLANIAKRLATSAPIWTYLAMLSIGIAGIEIPKPFLHFFEIVGKANPFLAMLLIGLSVNLRIDFAKFRPLIKLLFWRYVINAAIAVLCFWLMPVSEEIRKALLLVMMAPMPAMGLVFTMKANLDWETAANLNSLSVIVSVIIMSTLLAIL